MRKTRSAAALVVTCALLVAGCGSGSPKESTAMAYVSGFDVGGADRYPAEFDTTINFDDPRAVEGVSTTVLSGTVLGELGTSLDPLMMIHTTFEVRVDEVFKGNLTAGETIEIRLAGGVMTLGEYIKALDAAGTFEQEFPVKSEEFYKEHGIDPNQVPDPRKQDPATPVVHNLGSNPTSASLNEQVAPDAWLYFLNQDDDGTYYGSVLNHSLMYLKGGFVHSLFAVPGEVELEPLSVEELRQVSGQE